MRLIGLAAIGAGLLLRAVALDALGRDYSASARVPERLVTDGPYGRVRHPMYLGSILFLNGIAWVFLSWTGRYLTALLCVLYFGDRIDEEERLLAEHFGASHEPYRRRTWRLVPYLY